MAAYSKYTFFLASLVLCAGFTVSAEEVTLSTAKTTFSATVIDGSCDWIWSESVLAFLPINEKALAAGKTLEIKPLSGTIKCNLPLTPQLMVTGNTPFSDTASVFLDGSNASNIGFMLQIDDGSQTMPELTRFYNNGINGKAMVNNVPFTLKEVKGGQQEKQLIWIGLVGMVSGNPTVPGKFSASVTLTGIIP